VQNIFLGLCLSSVDINKVRYGLKNIDRNPNGQGKLSVRNIYRKNCIQAVH
jgi:hypothetical protein